MISYLKGTLASKDSYGIELEAGGLGFELSMSTKALALLPPVGSTTIITTYMQVKDDGITLYGFADKGEKAMFTKLIGVSGIGPKMAIAALSTYDAGELATIIAAGDVTLVSRVPGIGKKTAQRVILELQGILKTESETGVRAPAGSALADASLALQGMGFSPDEVSEALKGVSVDDKDASALIKFGLKFLGGKR